MITADHEDSLDRLGGNALRGMKLLSKKHLALHPRGQVATLRRIAVRALSDADWREGIPTKQNPRPPRRLDFSPEETAFIAARRQKAYDALAAAVALNRLHGLGY